jgi:hypothetical protein
MQLNERIDSVIDKRQAELLQHEKHQNELNSFALSEQTDWSLPIETSVWKSNEWKICLASRRLFTSQHSQRMHRHLAAPFSPHDLRYSRAAVTPSSAESVCGCSSPDLFSDFILPRASSSLSP